MARKEEQKRRKRRMKLLICSQERRAIGRENDVNENVKKEVVAKKETCRFRAEEDSRAHLCAYDRTRFAYTLG